MPPRPPSGRGPIDSSEPPAPWANELAAFARALDTSRVMVNGVESRDGDGGASPKKKKQRGGESQ